MKANLSGLNRRSFLKALGVGVTSLTLPRIICAHGGERPNVLFIALDDLNDWIKVLNPDAPIRTPNIERLAERGTLFTKAYCASPACNPSRTAILTGFRPSTSGVYGNKSDWRGALPDAVTIPQHFMAHGYRTEGAGKIFHHHYGSAFHDKASFDDFLMMPDPPDAPMPETKLNGLQEYGSRNTDWGPWPAEEAKALDVRTANYVIRSLARKHKRAFFLAAGIFRPHMPFFAPQRFFDLYPRDDITMPRIIEDDLVDLPSGATTLLKPKKWFFKELMEIEAKSPGTWKEAVRSYQASATFADAQVGRIIDALDKSDYADNTIIVLWSDHGYHLGEMGKNQPCSFCNCCTRDYSSRCSMQTARQPHRHLPNPNRTLWLRAEARTGWCELSSAPSKPRRQVGTPSTHDLSTGQPRRALRALALYTLR